MKKMFTLFAVGIISLVVLAHGGYQRVHAEEQCCRKGWLYRHSDNKCYASKPYVPPRDSGCTYGQWCTKKNVCADTQEGIDCDPWSCKPCESPLKCQQDSFGQYACHKAKGYGEYCNPNNICGDCVEGSTCINDALFKKYVCKGAGINLCDYVSDPTQRKNCKSCFEPSPPAKPGSWTAIGCIQTNPADFIKTLLGFGIGIAGGIAFLLILLGGFQILTSSGNPEQLNAGKELVGAAVTGLLLIIFSLFLLRLIGFSILGIPGFG